VTVVVGALVESPTSPPVNALEILEVRLFREDELPAPLAHGQDELFAAARAGTLRWE
jgi:8-oxo-dGTP diphosphatase